MGTKQTLPKLIAVEQEPVINMSAEHKKLWMDALRSGDYAQETGALCAALDDNINFGYCCLGVMQQVISGDVSRFTQLNDVEPGEACGLPYKEWLHDHGVTFNGSAFARDIDFKVQYENGEVLQTSASTLNDDGYTFVEIADLLEPLIETY